MSSINPYDLLNVTSKSSLSDLKKNYYQLSLYCHPDKGGSADDMVIIKNAYEYIKSQLENSTQQTYEELEQEFQEFCKIQENNPPKFCNIFSETHEEWSKVFNSTYSEQQYSNLFDKGYGEFMDQSDNKMDYKPEERLENEHNFTSDIVIYKEPFATPIDVDHNMPLDKKEILDFTYKGMSDYKKAFSINNELYSNFPERNFEDYLKERNSTKKILILYCNSKYSGNYFTALRISKYFNNSSLFNCLEKDKKLNFEDYEHVIAIHLNKCYDYLKNIKIPYTVIIAGTDCNYDKINDYLKYKTILEKCSNIITFNDKMKNRTLEIYKISQNIKIIPQAVEFTFENEEIKFEDYFLWVGKLRKIKNPELLIEIANNRSDLNFIIIGECDEEYKNLNFPSNVIYLGTKNRNTVLNYINKANALINTSHEEGMSDTILSSMGLGTPVIATKNSGNSSIINSKTGFLYENLNDFNQILKLNLKKHILNAKIYIHNNHNLINENIEYQNIIN
jgi:glycosyltransferase involved in cell wall biosynthesis